MHTVIPANMTARPEVSTASMIACSFALPALQALAVARDDKERVVDADTEPDQERELRTEGRHVHHMREQADHCDRASERDSRGHERQECSKQGTEDQEQHDERRDGAEAGAADARLARG